MRNAILSLAILVGFASALTAVQSQEAPSTSVNTQPPPERNLHLWIPVEDLKVWDPINSNVNPVPWRVNLPADPDQTKSAIFRHEAIGKKLRFQGIAWGYDVQTEMPKSRLVFEGGTVLVADFDLNAPEYRGKLVQIVGTLERKRMDRPGFERAMPEYYCIKPTYVRLLERVTEPTPTLLSDE